MILKVNPKSELIIDGFQYTLEWAEPPAISDLYRVTEKNQKLTDGIGLDSLKMKLVKSDYRIDWKIKLRDKGKLKIE